MSTQPHSLNLWAQVHTGIYFFPLTLGIASFTFKPVKTCITPREMKSKINNSRKGIEMISLVAVLLLYLFLWMFANSFTRRAHSSRRSNVPTPHNSSLQQIFVQAKLSEIYLTRWMLTHARPHTPLLTNMHECGFILNRNTERERESISSIVLQLHPFTRPEC